MIRLLSGDARDVLPTLPAESVQCCITSPPYYALRSYLDAAHPDKHREIGSEPTPDEYLATLVGVFREVRRVLRRDGVCFINMGDSYAGSQRATAYGTADTEPASSTGDGCLCGSLCDGCRKAYRIGRFHSDGQHVPTPVVSSVSSILEHKSEKRGRVPTSDFPHQRDHSLGAMRDPAPTSRRAIEPLHDALASTTTECETPPRDECLRTDTDYVCLSCGCSLAGCVLASADTTFSLSELRSASDARHRHGMSTDGTASTDGSSPARTSDTACDYCAYRQSTITSHPRAKPKDLLLMPARLALALQADGWWVRSDIIWHKPNPMPESCRDRPTSAHEHVFLLTRSARYFYDADAVREATGNEMAPDEYAAAVSGYPGRSNDMQDFGGGRGRKGFLSATPPSGRNLRNVWTIATHAYPEAHFATFPPELAERCIKAGTSERGCCAACGKPWVREVDKRALSPLIKGAEPPLPDCWKGDQSRPRQRADDGTFLPRTDEDRRPVSTKGVRASVTRMGDGWDVTTTGWAPGCQCGTTETRPCVVLDCFAGAGTSLLVADRLQRDAIGIELNTAYTEMAMERCRADAPLFTAFPPAEDPEDERMGDLFAEAEYHEAPPRKPNGFRWNSDRYLNHAAQRNNGMPEAAD